MEEKTENGQVEAQSLADRLRARRNEQATKRDTIVDLPGYGRELAVRYVWLDPARRKQLGEKIQRERSVDRELYTFVDTLVNACEEVLVLVNGEYMPLNEFYSRLEPDATDLDYPIKYDERLARFLAIELPSYDPRAVLLAVFGGNDVAISEHAVKVSIWFGDTTKDVNQSVLGLALGE